MFHLLRDGGYCAVRLATNASHPLFSAHKLCEMQCSTQVLKGFLMVSDSARLSVSKKGLK